MQKILDGVGMVRCDIKELHSRDLFPLILSAVNEGSRVKFTVSGNSMRPWIVHNRDQVLLSSVDIRRLRVGDIILFVDMDDRYILHRIYKRSGEGYYTIGDACLHSDGLVVPSQVKGVVQTIYRKGKEIDCSSLWWRIFSVAWQRLLPFRKHLLRLYRHIVILKGKAAGNYD